ncbi:fatty acid 2-hydroxylase-like [Zophobas morio]
MQKVQHSKAALYLLRQYKKGGRDTSTKDNQDDLESLVDWEQPILGQVMALGSKYKEWVNLPIDRKVRFFGNPVVEKLTMTPWYLIPIIWIPIAVIFIMYGRQTYVEITGDTSYVPIALSVLFGILLWSFSEYCLHRWLFHFEPSGKYKFVIYFHFVLHGLHHKLPFDKRTWIFPPQFAVFFVYGKFSIFRIIFPESIVFQVLAGALLG